MSGVFLCFSPSFVAGWQEYGYKLIIDQSTDSTGGLTAVCVGWTKNGHGQGI